MQTLTVVQSQLWSYMRSAARFAGHRLVTGDNRDQKSITRCSVLLNLPLVQRSSISPRFTMMVPGERYIHHVRSVHEAQKHHDGGNGLA